MWWFCCLIHAGIGMSRNSQTVCIAGTSSVFSVLGHERLHVAASTPPEMLQHSNQSFQCRGHVQNLAVPVQSQACIGGQ